MFLLGWSNTVEKWECKDTRSDGFGDWKGLLRHKAFAPCGLQVDGREIGRSSDAELREKRLDAAAVGGFGEANDEDEPADGAVGHVEWGQLKRRDISQKNVETFGGSAAEGEDFVDAAELDAAEGAGDIGEAVVESDIRMM